MNVTDEQIVTKLQKARIQYTLFRVDSGLVTLD